MLNVINTRKNQTKNELVYKIKTEVYKNGNIELNPDLKKKHKLSKIRANKRDGGKK